MGTLNYNTRYMKKKIQNIPYTNMTKLDRLIMMMELAGILGKFKDLDPREFGADYDHIIDDNKNDIHDTSRDI